MYTLLYIIILINIIIINKKLYGTLLKPNILFSGVWCIAAGVASLGLFDIYKPSNMVQFYSLTVVIFFNITYYILNRWRLKKQGFSLSGDVRIKILYFFNIVAWLYTLKFLIRSINIILNEGGFKVLRLYAFDSEMGLATTSELMIMRIFVNAIFSATMIIAVVLIITKNKHKNKVFIIAVIDVLINTLLFGGRGHLFKFALFYIFAFLIYQLLNRGFKRIKINKKLLILIIFALISLTIARSWSGINLFEVVVQYLTGGFNNLSVILDESAETQYLWGTATLGFFVNIIFMVISVIFGFEYYGSDQAITSVTAISRYISPTMMTNSTTTIIYPFFRDLGYWGILLGTVFLASLTSVIEKKFIRLNSTRMFCLYILILQALFNSISTYNFLLPSTGFTIIFIFLFVSNNNELIGNDSTSLQK